ncbi:MAG: glycosyltransferase family 2 protein [Candidatus Omnitrophica bacterium]|nr:glycosyltransferase family 2 protein [Candidatus Omnitrophota bacterium]
MNLQNKKPFFSIITPTYNREYYLENRVIKSVLNQEYKEWELVIIDDCSTDNTQMIIEKYIKKDSRIIYYRLPKNQGANFARNIGIEISKGEWLIFLDSDDELLCGALGLINSKINEIKHKNIFCLYFNTIDEKNKIISKHPFKEIILEFDDIYFWHYIVNKFNLQWEHLTCVNSDFIKKKNIKYPEDPYLEYVFHLEVLRNTPIMILDIPCRKYYTTHRGRLSTKVDISKFNNLKNNMILAIQILENYKPVKKNFIKSYKEKILGNCYLHLVHYSLLSGNKKEIVKWLIKSISYGNFSIKHFLYLLMMILPYKFITSIYYIIKKIIKK